MPDNKTEANEVKGDSLWARFLSLDRFRKAEDEKAQEVADDVNDPDVPSSSYVQAFWHSTQYAPLGAALLAPLANLYDIPGKMKILDKRMVIFNCSWTGLSQKWYQTPDGTQVADERDSLILSSISLSLSIIANGVGIHFCYASISALITVRLAFDCPFF
jgi:hypothetical protein